MSESQGLDADEVARKAFATGFRGFDQHEVHAHLGVVAAELAAVRKREQALEERLVAAEAARVPTTAQLEEALGVAAAQVLHDARDVAAEIRQRTEQRVGRMLREASAELGRLRQQSAADVDVAAAELARLHADAAAVRAASTADAEAAAAAVREEAERAAAAILGCAEAEAAAVRAEAAERRAEAERFAGAVREEAERAADAQRAEADGTAATVREEAERAAAAILGCAEAEAAAVRAEAAERRAEAEAAAATVQAEAERAASARRAQGEADATELLEAAGRSAATLREEAAAAAGAVRAEAEERARSLVGEAESRRERVLRELQDQRRAAEEELEQLRTGRDRMLEGYRRVQDALDAAVGSLGSGAAPGARGTVRDVAVVERIVAALDAEAAGGVGPVASAPAAPGTGAGSCAGGPAAADPGTAGEGVPLDAESRPGEDDPVVAARGTAGEAVGLDAEARRGEGDPVAAGPGTAGEAVPPAVATPGQPGATDGPVGTDPGAVEPLARVPAVRPTGGRPGVPVPRGGEDVLARFRADREARVARATEVLATPPAGGRGAGPVGGAGPDVGAGSQGAVGPVAAEHQRGRQRAASGGARPQGVGGEPSGDLSPPTVEAPGALAGRSALPATQHTAPTTEAPAAAVPGQAVDVAASELAMAFERRDALLEPHEAALTRLLKRALTDEQNALLDALRRARAARSVDELLGPIDDRARRHAALAEPILATAAAVAAGTDGVEVARHAAELADALGREVATGLGRRLDRALEAGGEEDDDLARNEVLSASYREWRSSRVELLAGHAVVAAAAAGAYAAAVGPSVWVVDPEGGCSPDCADNALAGPTAKGEAFPTGHLHPPAHPGCRCLVMTAAN